MQDFSLDLNNKVFEMISHDFLDVELRCIKS